MEVQEHPHFRDALVILSKTKLNAKIQQLNIDKSNISIYTYKIIPIELVIFHDVSFKIP